MMIIRVVVVVVHITVTVLDVVAIRKIILADLATCIVLVRILIGIHLVHCMHRQTRRAVLVVGEMVEVLIMLICVAIRTT